MTRRILIVLSIIGLIAAVVPAAGADGPPGLDQAGNVVDLPDAAGNSPVIHLGTTFDEQSGTHVEGYAIIHYRRGYHHRPDHDGGPGNGGPGGGNDGGDDGSTCFAFLGRGASWNAPEPYVLDSTNDEGLTEDFVSENLAADLDKWEAESGAEIFRDEADPGDADFVADTDSTDGYNEVYFGDVDGEGAIAVTIVWGVFSGPPFNRRLVEWDMVFDDADFDWSASGEAGKMDFENIATHETGHAAGLGHPDDSCTEETMYRFAEAGETKKRSLEAGDIAGINELY